MFWLALLTGAGYAGWIAWQGRRDDTEPAPEWPPLDPSPASAPTLPASTSATTATWVAPVDGVCPDGYPIKANANSGIFHVPGGRFYDRTVPERCYADAADAEADGYRRAKA
jgi:hypothetical protein